MSQATLEDQVAFAKKPETTGNIKASKPMTGEEFLESLRDGREVYIYGERVKDVTTHPAFRNTARMIARSTMRCTTPSTRRSSWCRPTPAMAA